MATRLVLAIFLLFAIERAMAWGPLFEPLKGGWNMGRTALQALHSSSDSHKEEEQEDSAQRRLRTQTNRQQQHSTFYYEDVDFHQILNRPMASSLSFDWNSILDDLLIVEDECFGAECEQECSIPEEYKTTKGGENFDVMGYLGIKRAEPLRVKEGYDSAWE